MKGKYAIVGLMLLTSCGTRRLANTTSHQQNDMEAERYGYAISAADIASITDRVRSVSDRSRIMMRFYFPPDSTGVIHPSADIEISNDIIATDSISNSENFQSSDTILISDTTSDKSVSGTEVTQKPLLSWWQKGLIWAGLAFLLYVIIRIVWKIWGPKISGLLRFMK